MFNSVEQGSLAAVITSAEFKSVTATTATISGVGGTTTVGVSSTAGIAVGMTITGTGISSSPTVVSSIGTNSIVVSHPNASTVSGTGVFSSYKQLLYTTEDPHNFQVGQSVTVVGINGVVSANVSGLTIVNVPTPKSFIVGSSSAFVFTTTPTVGTGVNAVTAYATNSWASIYEIKYATPEPATVAPFYLEVVPNIKAETVSPYPTDGSVSVYVNWTGIGGSNPLASFTVTQTVDSSTTTILSSAPSVGSTTITGLTADTIYTFGITASNLYSSVSSSVNITVPKLIYAMQSISVLPTSGVGNSISISWVRPTVSSPLPSRYELERASSTDNVNWSAWSVLSTSITSTTYLDSTAANSTYYKYRVRAFNGLYSPYLESSSTRAYFITSPMVTPTLSNTSTSSTNITVNASGYVSNPNITSWNIERSIDSSSWTSVVQGTPTLPYVDSGPLNQNTTYFYRISAGNGQVTSTVSYAASRTTYSTTAAPTNLNATAPKYNQVNLTWSTAVPTNPATPAIDYKIERSLTGTSGWSVVTSTATGVSYTDTTTSELTTYYYRISARNGLGYSDVSSNASVSTPVKEIATTTTISSNNVTWPSDLTISGTVSPVPSGGTITIRNGTTVLKTGVAVNTSTGAYSTTIDSDATTYSSLNAIYSGFDVYLSSTSGNTSGTISKASSSISASIGGTINEGGSTTMSGSLGLAYQTVYIYTSAGGYVTATSTDVNGNYAVTLSPGTGTSTYYANFPGNTNYNASSSGNVSIYVRTKKYGSYTNNLTQGTNNWAQGSASNRNQVATSFTMPGDPGNGATSPVIYQLDIAFGGYGSGKTGGITPYLWNSNKVAIAGGAFTTAGAIGTSSPIPKVACNLDDVTVSWSTSYWAGFVRSLDTAYYTQWAVNFTTGYTTWEKGSTSDSNVSGKSLIFTVQYYYYQ